MSRSIEVVKGQGIYVDSSQGICIDVKSPAWQLSDSELAALLKDARETWPYLEDAERIECYLLNSNGRLQTWVLNNHPEILSAMQGAERNPYITQTEKFTCMMLLAEWEEWQQGERTSRSAAPKLRTEVLSRDKYQCRYCGKAVTTNGAHIDHVIPYSLGGLTEKDNLVTACRACNVKKAGKTLEEAGLRLRPE